MKYCLAQSPQGRGGQLKAITFWPRIESERSDDNLFLFTDERGYTRIWP